MGVYVVVSAEVIVAGATRIDADLLEFPQVPPPTGEHSLDVLGTFIRGSFDDFHLLLSEEIAEQALQTLSTTHDFSFEQRDRLGQELNRLLNLSSGDVVRPNQRTQVPPGIGAAANAAIRCATTSDLRDPRVVLIVTDDEVASKLDEWTPPGVPCHGESHLRVMRPSDFNRLVEKARRHMRHIEE